MSVRCIDCGLRPGDLDHSVFWSCSQAIGKRDHEWVTCNRCLLKRGREDAVEMRELERADGAT